MAKAIKASDKQAIGKKIVAALKKRYSGTPPKKQNRSVLDTMLFAALLEDGNHESAAECLERLLESFHDLNEIRVSSISEVEPVLKGLENPEWKALRIRSCLHYVFEKNYEFDFEVIKRKNMELAERNLSKIPHISPFMKAYTLQNCLGGHIVPLDTGMANAAIFLGFVEPSEDVDKSIAAIKSSVKKPDVEAFCHALRQLSRDTKLRAVFDGACETAEEGGNDLLEAQNRLKELFKSPARFRPRRKKVVETEEPPASKKTAKKSKSVKKKPARKVAQKPVAKKAVKKKAVKKKAVKKKAVKKKAVKKKATKKKTVKKSAARKKTVKKKATRKKKK